MKKGLLTIVIIIGIVVGVGIGSKISNSAPNDKQVLSTKSTPTATATIVPEMVQPGIPQTVEIPKLSVKTAIESVGNDAEGRMDVPRERKNTSWYNLGFRPGENGNAVIAGHYDNVDSSPSVFYDLGTLQVGDHIIVTDDKGKAQTFAVTKTTKYPDAAFPIDQVFGAASDPMLNLITCHGNWDEQTKNYSERLVVYSQLVTN